MTDLNNKIIRSWRRNADRLQSQLARCAEYDGLCVQAFLPFDHLTDPRESQVRHSVLSSLYRDNAECQTF